MSLIFNLRLTPNQWRVLASALSNISQAVILFSFAAIFVPEAISLEKDFPKQLGIYALLSDLWLLLCAIMMSRDKQ